MVAVNLWASLDIVFQCLAIKAQLLNYRLRNVWSFGFVGGELAKLMFIDSDNSMSASYQFESIKFQ